MYVEPVMYMYLMILMYNPATAMTLKNVSIVCTGTNVVAQESSI